MCKFEQMLTITLVCVWTGHSKSAHCEDTQETQSPLFVQSSNLLLALRVDCGWQFVCFQTVLYRYYRVYLISDGKGLIHICDIVKNVIRSVIVAFTIKLSSLLCSALRATLEIKQLELDNKMFC